MTEPFDIRDEIDDRGILGGDEWSKTNETIDEVHIEHESDVEIRIVQRKPLTSDLPFSAVRVDQRTNDEQQIAEGDHLTSVLESVEAYMLGITDRGQNEMEDIVARIGRMANKVEEQQELIERKEERIAEQEERLDEREERLDEQEEQLAELEQTLTDIEDKFNL